MKMGHRRFVDWRLTVLVEWRIAGPLSKTGWYAIDAWSIEMDTGAQSSPSSVSVWLPASKNDSRRKRKRLFFVQQREHGANIDEAAAWKNAEYD